MYKINKFMSLIALAIVIAILPFVSGASMTSDNITIVTPGVGGILNGSAAVFNCTITAGYEAENWTSAKVWLQSAGKTANTTEKAITAFILNRTDYTINGTLDSTDVEDANDYIFKCQLWNGTNYLNKTRTGITINNTIPTAPSSLSPADLYIDTDGNINFSATVVDKETTGCTIYFKDIILGNIQSAAMAYSGDSCSYYVTGADEKTYGWYVVATDESDIATSSTNVLEVDIKTSAGKTAVLRQLEEEGKIVRTGPKTYAIVGEEGILATDIMGIPIWLIIVLAGVIAVIYFFVRKK